MKKSGPQDVTFVNNESTNKPQGLQRQQDAIFKATSLIYNLRYSTNLCCLLWTNNMSWFNQTLSSKQYWAIICKNTKIYQVLNKMQNKWQMFEFVHTTKLVQNGKMKQATL